MGSGMDSTHSTDSSIRDNEAPALDKAPGDGYNPGKGNMVTELRFGAQLYSAHYVNYWTLNHGEERDIPELVLFASFSGEIVSAKHFFHGNASHH